MSLSNYFPSPLKEIQIDSELNFGLHIYFRINNKMVTLAKSGDIFTKDIQDKFLSKGIQIIYIDKEDREKFYQYKSNAFTAILKNEEMGLAEKQKLLQENTLKTLKNINDISNKAESEQLMENCSGMTKNIVTNVSSKTFANLFDEINKMVKTGSGLMVHSANVSSLAVLFGMLSGVTDPKDLEALAMGGLLHDLGLSQCKEEITIKYLDNKIFTAEEWEEFQLHPQAGVEMLQGTNKEKKGETSGGTGGGVNGDLYRAQKGKVNNKNVIDIIFQHHENFDGNGFPRRIKNMQINFLTKIVRIANDFDILYRRLVREEKYKEIPNILAYLKENKYPITQVVREIEVPSQNFTEAHYDLKILNALLFKMSDSSSGAWSEEAAA